jgi:tRNA uridine 5-carboxymethylaminomethyl modification enzyme
MMTSRSEYRLLLRQDNADKRLTPLGREVGVVDDVRWNRYLEKQDAIEVERKRLRTTKIHPSSQIDEALSEYDETVKQVVSLEDLLRRPRLPYSLVEKLSPADVDIPFAFGAELETDIKYAGYIERQISQVEQTEKLDGLKLPVDIDYMSFVTLSKEAREKLNRVRPETVGQAARMAGVSPADLGVLLVWMESKRRTVARAQALQAASVNG